MGHFGEARDTAVAATGRDVVLYASGFVDAVAGRESDNVGTRDRLGTRNLESGLGLVDDLEASQARVIDRMVSLSGFGESISRAPKNRNHNQNSMVRNKNISQ